MNRLREVMQRRVQQDMQRAVRLLPKRDPPPTSAWTVIAVSPQQWRMFYPLQPDMPTTEEDDDGVILLFTRWTRTVSDTAGPWTVDWWAAVERESAVLGDGVRTVRFRRLTAMCCVPFGDPTDLTLTSKKPQYVETSEVLPL